MKDYLAVVLLKTQPVFSSRRATVRYSFISTRSLFVCQTSFASTPATDLRASFEHSLAPTPSSCEGQSTMTIDADALIGPHEVHDIDSTAVGDTFRVFVADCASAMSPGEPETTLVVTDANGFFATATQLVRSLQLTALVPPMRVVGIGYPAGGTIESTIQLRARDFTSSHLDMFELSGGGEHFRGFIADELMPWLESRWAGSTKDWTYFGHSLGGLFGIETVLRRPSLFSRYIVGSPSLWWGGYETFDAESARAAKHDDLVANVYSAIADAEDDDGRRLEGRNLPEGHPFKPYDIPLDMVADLDRFVDAITGRGYPTLKWTNEILPGEYHVTVGPVLLSRGLRHFFAER
jgi:predicted alpha/beta superfamily hydrolase